MRPPSCELIAPNDVPLMSFSVCSCLSPTCYNKQYGADPVRALHALTWQSVRVLTWLAFVVQLEEGEIDTIRGRSYRACVRTCVPPVPHCDVFRKRAC